MNTEHNVTPEQTEEPSPWPGWPALFFACFGRGAGTKGWSKPNAYALLIMLAGFAARFGLEGYLPEVVLDYGIAVALASSLGIVYWATWHSLRGLDEMHQRIMLEAIAFSFFTTMTLAVFVGIAGLARRTSIDVVLVFVAAEVLRGVGVIVAARRYR